jgi:endonuclease-3
MKHREAPAEIRSRIRRGQHIIKKLTRLFPDAGMMLAYRNEWELLVAVELSAQCTDKKVNEITPALFKRYPTLKDYIVANPREFEQMIFQSGFYRNKTKNILAAAKMLQEVFHGKLPRTMEEMMTLPGVARKTANVVLGNAHGIVEGIAVDTHVKRLSHMLGLSDETDPNKIEKDLMGIFQKKDWFRVTYLLIEYGRKYCTARKHDHAKCPLGYRTVKTKTS